MLTALQRGHADVDVRGARLRGDDLAGAVGAVSQQVAGCSRVAVEATPTLETVVAVAGVLAAGGCVVPLNPSSGVDERRHVVEDAAPDLVLTTTDIDVTRRAALPPPPPMDDTTALVVYTSGTTGRPKGAAIPRRALVACLDALAARWEWTDADVLAHALPLFHVHGLVLGTLGPLRIGMALRRTDRFGAADDASMYFAVPTMWSRIVEADLAAMSGARLLVSGSAALPAPTFARVRAVTGHPLVERYGLTESLIVPAATPATAAAGQVGRPLDGVGVRIADADESGMGEVQLRG